MFALILPVSLLAGSIQASEILPIRFGVLSIAQPARIFAKWTPFVKHLETQLGRPVVIVVPKGFSKMKQAVANKEVDFFYVNSHVFYRLKQEGRALAVAQMQPWLDGTTVSLNNQNQVTMFHKGTMDTYSDIRYKTVNIYSFSLLSWQLIVKRLNQYISDGNVNCYYEIVFSEMIDDKTLTFESVSFDHEPWYEIDTIIDLAEAEKIFPLELSVQAIPESISA